MVAHLGNEPGQTDIKTEAHMHQITLGDLPAHSRLILVENDGRIGQIQRTFHGGKVWALQARKKSPEIRFRPYKSWIAPFLALEKPPAALLAKSGKYKKTRFQAPAGLSPQHNRTG